MAASSSTAIILGHVKWTPDLCGNVVDGGKRNCDHQATMLCTNCQLVGYCSQECLKDHSHVHEAYCNDPLRTESFLPEFCGEDQSPADYIFPGAAQLDIAQLWGTNRAMDVLNLQNNEGEYFQQPLTVFFANCNDLRDVIKTVNSLPTNYTETLHFHINHEAPAVTFRNTIILLLAMMQPVELAVDTIIHLWYSALLTRPMLERIRNRVLPYLNHALEEYRKANPSTQDLVLEWPTPPGVNCKAQFAFTLTDVILLQQLVATEHDKTAAMQDRANMMYLPQFIDAVELHMYNQRPQWRSSLDRYQQTGVLSPFGACLEAFDVVNATMFDEKTIAYNQLAFADPLDGWSIEELVSFPSGGPSHDLHGQLYYHLRAELEKFCVRITQGPEIWFGMTTTNACDPHVTHGRENCDRVHISTCAMEPPPANVQSDPRYWGLPTMLRKYAGFLIHPSLNPHATLIAVFEQYYEEDRKAALTKRERQTIMPKLRDYGFIKPPSLDSPEGKAFKVQIYCAAKILAPFDELFDKYMAEKHFDNAAAFSGLELKQQNTVADKWPRRFTRAPDEEGAKEAFLQKLAEDTKAEERIVEFKRRSEVTMG